jgi:serine/threonine-protein kinase
MLTGRVPFDGDNPVAVAMQHLHAAPVPIQTLAPDVPPAVIRVCMRAMEKNPAMRYQSARDMASDLRAALEERGEQIPYPENELEIRQPKPQVAGERNTNTGPRRPVRPRNRNKTIRIALNIVIALAVIAGLFFGGKAIYEQTIFTVKVPDVMGMNIEEAVRVLKQAGLTETHKAMPSDDVELNQVYVQNPGADTTIRKGDAVILVISSGPVPFEMPDVTNMTADEATNLLTAKKMTITRDRAASADVQKGRVMSQVPAAGDMVTRDDPVTLTISGGSTVIPSLIGHTLQEAEEMLITQNLAIHSTLKYEMTENAKEHGLVAATAPEAENRVAEDTPVQLTIYRYPEAECTATLSVTLPESDQQLKVRISTRAEGSSVAYTRNYTVEAGDSRLIEETIDIPDDRLYTYTVYIGDTQYEQKPLNPKDNGD